MVVKVQMHCLDLSVITYGNMSWKKDRLICIDVLLLVQAGPDENLKDVSIKILQNGVATVPIIYSSSEEGLYPQLLYLASLSEILKCKNLKT